MPPKRTAEYWRLKAQEAHKAEGTRKLNKGKHVCGTCHKLRQGEGADKHHQCDKKKDVCKAEALDACPAWKPLGCTLDKRFEKWHPALYYEARANNAEFEQAEAEASTKTFTDLQKAERKKYEFQDEEDGAEYEEGVGGWNQLQRNLRDRALKASKDKIEEKTLSSSKGTKRKRTNPADVLAEAADGPSSKSDEEALRIRRLLYGSNDANVSIVPRRRLPQSESQVDDARTDKVPPRHDDESLSSLLLSASPSSLPGRCLFCLRSISRTDVVSNFLVCPHGTEVHYGCLKRLDHMPNPRCPVPDCGADLSDRHGLRVLLVRHLKALAGVGAADPNADRLAQARVTSAADWSIPSKAFSTSASSSFSAPSSSSSVATLTTPSSSSSATSSSFALSFSPASSRITISSSSSSSGPAQRSTAPSVYSLPSPPRAPRPTSTAEYSSTQKPGRDLFGSQRPAAPRGDQSLGNRQLFRALQADSTAEDDGFRPIPTFFSDVPLFPLSSMFSKP